MEEIAEEALSESNNAIFFYNSLSFGRNSECKVIWTRKGGTVIRIAFRDCYIVNLI